MKGSFNETDGTATRDSPKAADGTAIKDSTNATGGTV
jgi:hypothetical protein